MNRGKSELHVSKKKILISCHVEPRARVNKNIWAFLSIWQVEHHLVTHTTNSRLLPSGDSSCTYVPVRYRWTKADFPLDRLPTMPCKVKSKILWLFLTGGHDRNKPQADVDRDGDLTKHSQHEVLHFVFSPLLNTLKQIKYSLEWFSQQ